jgi:hypothetical protein
MFEGDLMKRVIDADTHIPESEAMWSTFDKEMFGRADGQDPVR